MENKTNYSEKTTFILTTFWRSISKAIQMQPVSRPPLTRKKSYCCFNYFKPKWSRNLSCSTYASWSGELKSHMHFPSVTTDSKYYLTALNDKFLNMRWSKTWITDFKNHETIKKLILELGLFIGNHISLRNIQCRFAQKEKYFAKIFPQKVSNTLVTFCWWRKNKGEGK